MVQHSLLESSANRAERNFSRTISHHPKPAVRAICRNRETRTNVLSISMCRSCNYNNRSYDKNIFRKNLSLKLESEEFFQVEGFQDRRSSTLYRRTSCRRGRMSRRARSWATSRTSCWSESEEELARAVRRRGPRRAVRRRRTSPESWDPSRRGRGVNIFNTRFLQGNLLVSISEEVMVVSSHPVREVGVASVPRVTAGMVPTTLEAPPRASGGASSRCLRPPLTKTRGPRSGPLRSRISNTSSTRRWQELVPSTPPMIHKTAVS